MFMDALGMTINAEASVRRCESVATVTIHQQLAGQPTGLDKN
jgi:hypothetical protein